MQVVKDGKIIAYKYDHNDLRMEKEIDGRKTKYYYDGSLLLAEKDGNGNILKIYINDGEGIVGMIRYIYKNTGEFSHYQRLYYLYDSLGSVSVITGENGLPLQNYTYSPYGSKMNIDYDPVNNLRFVGRYGGYKDDDTGLTYFWHRWYDEKDGRWVSRDMIKSCFESNKFIYTRNRANSLIDFSGLSPIDILVPTYGKYCGPGYTGGERGTKRNFNIEPIDNLDNCCKQHDKCYYDCENKIDNKGKCSPKPSFSAEITDINYCKKKCNKDICNCILNIGASEGYNGDIYKYNYMVQAANYFCNK